MSKDKNRLDLSIILWILISIAFISFALLLILFLEIFFKEINFSNASYFGSFLSGATSLIAIALLFRTYQSQKIELQLTRDIAIRQERTLRQQKIESSFFSMLSILQETINSMEGSFETVQIVDTVIHSYKGRAYLRRASEELLEKLKVDISNLYYDPEKKVVIQEVLIVDSVDSSHKGTVSTYSFNRKVINTIEHNYVDLRNEVIKSYEEFYVDHQFNLGHYFRYVYNVIKFIVESDLKEDEKKYLGILQAQMSNDELGLIFYNAISRHSKTGQGEYKFHQWLDKYGVLENISGSSIYKPWHHWFYPNTAFKFLTEEERTSKKKFTEANSAKV